MLKVSTSLLEIESVHNQKAQISLVGNQTLQSKAKRSKIICRPYIQTAYYPYKCSDDVMQRLNCKPDHWVGSGYNKRR